MTGQWAGTASGDQTVWTIEAWRGLAALLVVYSHLHPLAGLEPALLGLAFTGVDLFFVLSGFVFAPYLAGGEARGRELRIAPFAIRRLFRIYPAYLLALLLYIGMKAQTGEPLRYVWEHLVFAHLQSREMTFYYNPPFWSLPAEVEYYLLLPLLALFIRGSLRRLAAVTLSALLMRLWLGHASDLASENRAYIWLHHLPGMGVEFLFGVLAWRFAPAIRQAATRYALLALSITAWLGLAVLFARLGDDGLQQGPLRGQIGWLAAICFGGMIAATCGSGLAAPKPLIWTGVWAGRLSYGTYLLHIAAFNLVLPHQAKLGEVLAPLAATLLTLAGAWLTYRFWEAPWRLTGRRLAQRLDVATRPKD